MTAALLLLLLAAVGQPSSAANANDIQLLLALKSSFTNGGSALKSWRGEDPCGGTWEGVTCGSAGEVNGILLYDLGLDGTIPDGGWELPGSLVDFGIFNNPGLHGQLPQGWALPPGLSRLLLGDNGLTGPLPQPWPLPEGLTVLNLGSNQLSGTLPAWTLPDTLEYLLLSNNSFVGGLPAGWDLPKGLRKMYLSNCPGLSGTISEDWSLNYSLEWLILSNNSLSGSIPETWILPNSMQRLDLSLNRLNGSIPTGWSYTFGMPDNMELVDLRSNDLSGTLPEWPTRQNVTVFIQPGNELLCGVVPFSPSYLNYTGGNELPQSLAPLPDCSQTKQLLAFKYSFNNSDIVLALWTGRQPCDGSWVGLSCFTNGEVYRIDLRDAGLQGTLPPGGWDLPSNLLQLWLSRNDIQGTLPEAWKLPDTLTGLSLNGCGLSGTLPANWTLPYSLEALDLSGNQLGGQPFGLALPPGLVHLFLDHNLFTGTLPSNWKLPDGLQVLTLGSNLLSGSVQGGAIGWQLPISLWRLELNDNRLTGSIPSQLVLPFALQRLLLHNNQLNGSIPEDWALPSYAENVTLSGNQLTGSLPQSWGRLLPNTVKFLWLDGNQITGELPEWANLPNATVVVEPGNKGLCGKVPESPQYQAQIGECGCDDLRAPPVVAAQVWDCNCSSTLNWLEPLPPVCTMPPPPPSPVLSPEWTSPSTPPPSPNDDSGSNAGLIVGAVAGSLGGIAITGLLAWWCWRKRQPSIEPTGGEGLKGDLGMEPGLIQAVTPSQDDPPSKLPQHKPELQALLTADPFLASLLSKLASGSTIPAGHMLPGQDSAMSIAPTAPSATLSRSNAPPTANPSEKDALGTRLRPGMELPDVKMWEIDFYDLELQRKIGEGSFGQVYLAKWQETQVAVKLLLGTASALANNPAAAAEQALSINNPVLSHLQEEAGMMAALRHPNVLNFIGVCIMPPAVVSEYCPRGSLFDILREAKTSPTVAKSLTWQRRLAMATDAAKGMLHLHSHKPLPLVHRDLKSPNLLVGKNWAVKVCDFNLSKFFEETASVASSSAVTNPRWLAPEVLNGQKHTFASDVFSFAVVLWEMLTWEVPWAGQTNIWGVARYVIDGGRLLIPDTAQFSSLGGSFEGLGAYLDLMKRCWHQDPQQRPSFGQIISELKRLAALAARPSMPPAWSTGSPAASLSGINLGGVPAPEAGVPVVTGSMSPQSPKADPGRASNSGSSAGQAHALPEVSDTDVA